MREALASGYMQTINWISEQIKGGWEDGSIPKTENLAAESIAKRWYYAWLSASLIARTSRSDISLCEVWQMTTSELGR